MTQGELVYMVIGEVVGAKVQACKEEGIPVQLSESELTAVHAGVLAGFQRADCNKNSGGTDEVALRKYIPGLVNNWVRKDKRLNGGTKYEPKNPGSRQGSGDDKLKNLKLLLTVVTDPEAKVAVQLEIDKRVEEIKPAAPTINEALIPEHLKVFLKK